MPAPRQYLIAIAVYNGVDLLDVSAPYERFNWMARIESQHNPAPPFTSGDPCVAQPPVYAPGAGRTAMLPAWPRLSLMCSSAKVLPG